MHQITGRCSAPFPCSRTARGSWSPSPRRVNSKLVVFVVGTGIARTNVIMFTRFLVLCLVSVAASACAVFALPEGSEKCVNCFSVSKIGIPVGRASAVFLQKDFVRENASDPNGIWKHGALQNFLSAVILDKKDTPEGCEILVATAPHRRDKPFENKQRNLISVGLDELPRGWTAPANDLFDNLTDVVVPEKAPWTVTTRMTQGVLREVATKDLSLDYALYKATSVSRKVCNTVPSERVEFLQEGEKILALESFGYGANPKLIKSGSPHSGAFRRRFLPFEVEDPALNIVMRSCVTVGPRCNFPGEITYTNMVELTPVGFPQSVNEKGDSGGGLFAQVECDGGQCLRFVGVYSTIGFTGKSGFGLITEDMVPTEW